MESRIGYVPERELEGSKKEANAWETKYRQAEEARVAAERRAGDTELAVTASADAATKEKELAEDLYMKGVTKYANLEKVAIASSGVALGKYNLLFRCRVPERVESPRVIANLLYL